MKKFWLSLLLLASLQSYGQGFKEVDFSEKVFESEFTDADKNIWPLKNNQYFTLLIRDGKYILQANEEQTIYLQPGFEVPGSYKLSTILNISKVKEGNGSVGLSADVPEKMDNGYLVEINQNGMFRVSQLKGAGNYRYITGQGKNKGWTKPEIKIKPNQDINLSLSKFKGKIYVDINGEQVYSFRYDTSNSGKCGLFLSGICNATSERFTVFAPKGDTSQDINIDFEHNGDITSLTNAVLECRKSYTELNKKHESAKKQLEVCSKKREELQKFITENLDVKLQNELEKQRDLASMYKNENDSLKKINVSLEDFKSTVKKNKDGDLVIIFSENLKKEKELNAALNEKLKKLQDENTRLINENKKLKAGKK